MIRIELPQDEAERLEDLFRTTEDRKLRDRLPIVLMAHRGRPRHATAEDLGIHRTGVTRWVNAYCERGLDGLLPREAGGAAPRIPDSMADEVKRRVIEGPSGQGLDRANWTHEELTGHLKKAHGIQASRSAMRRFCSKLGIRPYRPTYRYLRGDPDKQAKATEDLEDFKKAGGGELVLLSQDEARFQVAPTLTAALGVKGHRPVVGTRDCKDVLYVFAVLNLLSGAVHANTLEGPQKDNRKSEDGKTRGTQRAFAEHLRHVGRVYPQGRCKRVVLTTDDAPWHRGALIDEAMREYPHLEFYRMPGYSPQLNVVERFWKRLRRRATHNRLFDTITDSKGSARNSLRYSQGASKRLPTLTNGRPKKSNKAAG